MSNRRFHSKNLVMLRACVLVTMLAFCLSLFSVQPSKAQITDSNAYELIVQLKRRDAVLANSLLGFQVGFSSYYFPVGELSNKLEIYNDLDLENKKITGWIGSPENEFALDLSAGYYTMGGEILDLAPDDAFIRDYGGGFGDIYLKLERLNELLPLEAEFNFQELILNLKTFKKFPYELRLEREQARDRALASQNGEMSYEGYEVVANDYRMFSPPVIDVNTNIGRYAKDSEIRGNTNIYGRNDLLGFSADYNARFEVEDGEVNTPEALRLTLERIAYGAETMPLGVRKLKLGDVSVRTPSLLGGGTNGRGVTVSSEPVKRARNFDEIDIEGTGIPGYEIELYRNNELLDYGVIGETGQYRFEAVELLTGRNVFRTVLYGPQGQKEERVEEHTIGGGMLRPGEIQYEAGVVDTTDSFVSFEDDDDPVFRLEDKGQDEEGIAYSGYIATGVNRNMSVFATGTNTFTRQGERAYATIGTNYSVGNVQGASELYKEFGGGAALDNRLATQFQGWRVNLRSGLFNDFESDRAGYEDSAKTFDVDGRISRRFNTGLGAVGLNFAANYEKQEDEGSNKRFRAATTLSRGKQKYGNSLTATYADSDLRTISGRANATYRISRKWRNRSILNYSVYPTFDWDYFSTDMQYKGSKDFRAGFNYGHNLDETNDYRLGASLGYDFGTFLGSVDTNWRSQDGVDIIFRASTTLAPFDDDGGYVFDSRTKRTHNALRSKVFLDRNLNNVFDGDDEWLPETGILVDGREIDETDEAGVSSYVQAGRGDYAGVTLDEDRLTNPFHRTASKGYVVLLRPGVAQDVEIPVVETGVIDGSAYFENGNPIPGLKMQLVSGHGEVVKETMTSFDGFFVFEFIKPGTYIVRADPQLDVAVPPRTVIVSPDALFAYGVNVNMQEPPKSDIQVEKTQVQQNMASILTNLKKLQSTLSGAVKNDAEPL